MMRFAVLITALAIQPAVLIAADFYVAPDGRDENPGTKSKPFASFAKARDAIRVLRKAEPQRAKPVVVQIGGGDYFLKEPLIFSPEDSGTSNSPTIFRADAGDEAVISGGEAIIGLHEVSPGRWEAQLPDVAAGQCNFSQLYINDQRRPRPMLPKQGYYSVARQIAPTHGKEPDRFRFNTGEFQADWHNLSDIEVTTFHLWTMDRLRIKSVDDAQRVVTFTGPTHSWNQAMLSRETWYRIENVREALSQPGEWYLDRTTGVLTVLAMPGENLRKARVIAPRLGCVVRFDGRKDARVSDIILDGLTIAHNAWNTPPRGRGFPQAEADLDGAVTAFFSDRCGLERCVVRHAGSWAVDWDDGCRDDFVRDCELFDLGCGGVKVGPHQLGWEADTNKWSSGCVVENCLIAHGGRVLPAAVGIWIGHAGNNRIVRNEIADFCYSGMSIGWRWGAGFSPAHGNLIEANHIHDLGWGVLSDMGGIYTLGESPGTVLRGNHIHDVNRARYGGWGIYFDEGSSNIVAESNLVYRTQDAGQHQNYGSANLVRNNIFAFGSNAEIRVSDLRKLNGIRFERNIFFFKGANLFETKNFSDQMTFASNLYWREGGLSFVFAQDKSPDEWRKIEPGAMIADPMFVAPEQYDFRLNARSPAKQIGFVEFDASKAGRTTRSSRTAKLPPVLRVYPPAPPEHDLRRDFTFNEDFEAYSTGQNIYDFETQVCPGDVLAVTSDIAAGGRQSLNFCKGPPGQFSWTPHIYAFIRYEDGRARCSFDLRHEAGAALNHEWRDWPTWEGKPYKTGPSLNVTGDGSLIASGKKLLVLPAGAWTHIEIVCGFGAQDDGTYSVAVTLPGQPPQKFDGLRHQDGFKAMDWIGFSTFGKQGSQYQIDNFKLTPIAHP